VSQALNNGFLEVIKVLMNFANIRDINRLLSQASGIGNLEVVKYLLDAKLNILNNGVNQAILKAPSNGHVDAVITLLKVADRNAKFNQAIILAAKMAGVT